MYPLLFNFGSEPLAIKGLKGLSLISIVGELNTPPGIADYGNRNQ